MKQAANDVILALGLLGMGLLFWIIAGPVNASGGNPVRPLCDYDSPAIELVYTRQARHTDPVGVLGEAANWQRMRDVGRYNTFSESDVVIDCRDGHIPALYSCTGDDSQVCAAMEAKVSPDGKLINFTRYVGNSLRPVRGINGGPLIDDPRVNEFTFTRAELWVHEVTTGKTYNVGEGGAADWCGNDCLVFEKEADVYPSHTYSGNSYPTNSHQLHRGYLRDGKLTDVVNLTPHEQYIMSPRQMTDGRICYSSFQGYWPRGVGFTPPNLWWGICVNGNGSGPTEAEYAAHGSIVRGIYPLIQDWVDPARRGEYATKTKAPRGLGEPFKDVYCWPNYYRSNSTGPFGLIDCYKNQPGEGAWYGKNIPAALYQKDIAGQGQFTPSTIYTATPGGQDQDLDWPRFHKDGRAAGRASFPEPWPGGADEWLYTHARGWCFEAAQPFQANRAAMGGEPTCKKQIQLAKQRVVSNPFDPAQSECIAGCEDKWHAWDAHAIAPWSELYGIDGPPAPEPITGSQTLLRVVDARKSELLPFPNATANDKITLQGNATNGNSEDLEYVVISYVDLWQQKPTRVGFYNQYVMDKRDEVGTQGKTVAFTPDTKVVRAKVEADGSVEIPIDCEKPFVMHGETAEGVVTAIDNSPLSLRCGEVRTCHGCHDAHSEEGLAAIGWESAEARFARTLAGKKAVQE